MIKARSILISRDVIFQEATRMPSIKVEENKGDFIEEEKLQLDSSFFKKSPTMGSPQKGGAFQHS
jgi:hypothetical protein